MNCESCGMPLEANTTSKHNEKYCIYCQNQETGDLKSYGDVRAGSIDAVIRLMGKSKEDAEQLADNMMPTLPRWKDQS